MGAEDQLRGIQQQIATNQGYIKTAESQLAEAKKSGNATRIKSATSLLEAAKQNIGVYTARAQPLIQQVAKEKFEAAQRAEAQRQASIKAEAQRQAELNARQQLELKKQQEAERASKIFESKAIQQEVKPFYETGEESVIAAREKSIEQIRERYEKTEAGERLEKGIGFFETGAGFKEASSPEQAAQATREKIVGTAYTVKGGVVESQPIVQPSKIMPQEPEGQFISGQITTQLAGFGEAVVTSETSLAAIKTEKGGKALEVFEQTVTSGLPESGVRLGSTGLYTAEELGLAINRPSEGIPRYSGIIAADIETTKQEAARLSGGTAYAVEGGKVSSQPIVIDPFELAVEKRKSLGIFPGEPYTLAQQYGYTVPEKPKSKAPTPSAPQTQDAKIAAIISQGGVPNLSAKIDSIFIPTDKKPDYFDKSAGGLFADMVGKESAKKPSSSLGIPQTSASFVKGAPVVDNILGGFESFLSGVSKSFGIGVTPGYREPTKAEKQAEAKAKKLAVEQEEKLMKKEGIFREITPSGVVKFGDYGPYGFTFESTIPALQEKVKKQEAKAEAEKRAREAEKARKEAERQAQEAARLAGITPRPRKPAGGISIDNIFSPPSPPPKPSGPSKTPTQKKGGRSRDYLFYGQEDLYK